MKAFEEGKSYRVNGGGIIQITKITKKYAIFAGDFCGRRKINKCFEDGLFGLGEFIVIPAQFPLFCYAEHEN